jgi:hypothetical protein
LEDIKQVLLRFTDGQTALRKQKQFAQRYLFRTSFHG